MKLELVEKDFSEKEQYLCEIKRNKRFFVGRFQSCGDNFVDLDCEIFYPNEVIAYLIIRESDYVLTTSQISSITNRGSLPYEIRHKNGNLIAAFTSIIYRKEYLDLIEPEISHE